jgi:hypothetical protein
MNYGVIFNRDLPPETQDAYIPLDWPMYLKPLKGDEYPPAGIARLSLDELNELRNKLWPEYEELQKNKQVFLSTRKLRVMDLVAFDFKTWHPSKIDFTKHLQTNIVLEKREVAMAKNGRPVSSTYYYGDTKIADISFVFESDYLGFMTRRIESLGYYTVDDQIHDWYVLWDEKFSRAVTYQHQKRLQERVEGRRWIVNSFMADIDAYTTGLIESNPSMAGSAGAAINQLLVDYVPQMETFINSGGTYFRETIRNDTTHGFLSMPLAPGVTVRSYIIDKLTY